MNLDLLSPQQQARYDDSLEVLRLMRSGTSFSLATKNIGLSNASAKKNLGKTLTKKNNRIIAKKRDSLPRKLKIYEDGEEKFIILKGTANSKRVARYHSAIGRRIDHNDKNALKPFNTVVDAKGKSHKLETNLESILDILQSKEESPFFSIYKMR